MLARSNRRPVVPSFVHGLPLSFGPPCVARSSGGSHKAVGTDTPAMVTSYIGSEEAADDDNQLVINTLNQTNIINDVAACAAAPVEVVADAVRDEVEYMMSPACAGEDVPEDAFPDRWAALSNEITPKAKAKGRGKAAKTTKEPKGGS